MVFVVRLLIVLVCRITNFVMIGRWTTWQFMPTCFVGLNLLLRPFCVWLIYCSLISF